jgi:antitoxin ParD1/3/4
MKATTTMRISLPATMKEYVERRVETGGYNSVSQYFEHLLREDKKQYEQDRKELERLLLEGLESGPALPWTPEDTQKIKEEVRATVAQRRLAKESKS